MTEKLSLRSEDSRYQRLLNSATVYSCRRKESPCFIWSLSPCQSASAVGSIVDPLAQTSPCGCYVFCKVMSEVVYLLMGCLYLH